MANSPLAYDSATQMIQYVDYKLYMYRLIYENKLCKIEISFIKLVLCTEIIFTQESKCSLQTRSLVSKVDGSYTQPTVAWHPWYQPTSVRKLRPPLIVVTLAELTGARDPFYKHFPR